MSEVQKRTGQLVTLKQLLDRAEPRHYAVGAFSPRYSPMVRPILRAGEAARSPIIVQIAQLEFDWLGISLEEFTAEFWRQFAEEAPTVPVCLHLDHTWNIDVIHRAIAAGFTSVMIDASAQELEENIAITREVAAYAHARGVSVEAELGRIGSADLVETLVDEQLYTEPLEAARFVEETQVDALAISIGTAHGVYRVRQPKIDMERLEAIRSLTDVHLVLHGGSGTPAEMVLSAIRLPAGGVSKVNIATDLKLALLAEIGRPEQMSDAEIKALPVDEIERGSQAVQRVVADKIYHFLGSQGRADED